MMNQLFKGSWLHLAFTLRGSVIPAVLPRVILVGIFGLIITVLYTQGVPLFLPKLEILIPSILLGLLLVFRTNTGYERFWLGRQAWGAIIGISSHLARQIWVNVEEKEPQDRVNKVAAMYSIAAFAVATKQYLRREPINEELENLLIKSRLEKITFVSNPALEIALWIQDYLKEQCNQNRLNIHDFQSLQQLLNSVLDKFGLCICILMTPQPRAYTIHLRQLTLIYCFTLPMRLVGDFGWLTSPIIAIIAFTLFGIEEIALEIENPFGRDYNDIPLDNLCDVILNEVEGVMKLSPKSTKAS
ncbi:bestrophin family ion channel [Microcoleus sp. BR0-C5]|uniref:bestrophin family ion channel n=1 Tax=Microcoleus sp. BR0-C5 TaxID=2818713 RepID=UPI002FD2F61B